jgi:putative transposase
LYSWLNPESPASSGKLCPRFATLDPDLMAAAIKREKAFLASYARQRERWLQGKKNVVFPCGTVWLRRNAPIKCRAPDAGEAGLCANM